MVVLCPGNTFCIKLSLCTSNLDQGGWDKLLPWIVKGLSNNWELRYQHQGEDNSERTIYLCYS